MPLTTHCPEKDTAAQYEPERHHRYFSLALPHTDDNKPYQSKELND